MKLVGLAKWLVLKSKDHKALSSNPIGDRVQLDCTVFLCTEPFIITLSLSRYDFNIVERNLKHEIIIIWLEVWDEFLQSSIKTYFVVARYPNVFMKK